MQCPAHASAFRPVAGAGADSLEELYAAFPALVGRAATAAERRAFDRYANLLIHWNRTHHLTALRTRRALGRWLFLDSLFFRAFIASGAQRVADIGAGAGVPGVPLRIVEPEMSLTLIESRRKPVSFLHALVRDLSLTDVMIHHARAEDLVAEMPELAGTFDVVLCRAVGLTRGLIEGAMPYLKPSGRLVAAGPPPLSDRPAIDWDGEMEWKDIDFREMRTIRSFLVCTKAS